MPKKLFKLRKNMNELVSVMYDILTELREMNSKLNSLKTNMSSIESFLDDIRGIENIDLSNIKSELEYLKYIYESMN